MVEELQGRIEEVLQQPRATKDDLRTLLADIRDLLPTVAESEENEGPAGQPLPEFVTPCGEVHRGYEWHLREHARTCKKCWERGTLVTDVIELPEQRSEDEGE